MTTKALKKQLMAAIAMVVVAAIALTSSTYAWFVNNNKVSATTSSIQAATAGANLMIVNGTSAENGKTTAEVTGLSSRLSPISTEDFTNWYNAIGWSADEASLANGYTKVNLDTKNITDAGYGYTTFKDASGETFNAYSKATYTAYTTAGTTNMYVNNIKITSNDEKKDEDGVLSAMRVGVKVGDEMFIYAPVEEAENTSQVAGNDSGITAAGLHCVKVTNTVGNLSTENASGKLTDSLPYYAAASGTNGTYTAGSKPLAAVTTTGVHIEVYMWLEGTDYQCVTDVADGTTDSNSYTVQIDFVGVTPTPASPSTPVPES